MNFLCSTTPWIEVSRMPQCETAGPLTMHCGHIPLSCTRVNVAVTALNERVGSTGSWTSLHLERCCLEQHFQPACSVFQPSVNQPTQLQSKKTTTATAHPSIKCHPSSFKTTPHQRQQWLKPSPSSPSSLNYATKSTTSSSSTPHQ